MTESFTWLIFGFILGLLTATLIDLIGLEYRYGSKKKRVR